MRLVRTGRTQHEVRQVYDVDQCSGCGGPLRFPNFAPRHVRCGHHDGGHWVLKCKSCGADTWDTSCDRPDQQHPLDGHAARGQWGPTLDVGER